MQRGVRETAYLCKLGFTYHVCTPSIGKIYRCKLLILLGFSGLDWKNAKNFGVLLDFI